METQLISILKKTHFFRLNFWAKKKKKKKKKKVRKAVILNIYFYIN